MIKIIKSLLVILALLINIDITFSQTGESPIEPKILKSVFKISTSPDKYGKAYSGTGFLISSKVVSG